MPNGRPHIAIHVERNADGSSWSAWRCTGGDVFAYGYTPVGAYAAWRVLVDIRAAIEQDVRFHPADVQWDEGRTLH